MSPYLRSCSEFFSDSVSLSVCLSVCVNSVFWRLVQMSLDLRSTRFLASSPNESVLEIL